ncbi:DUF6298 domain-containing protein [Candidatus Poribacteria bacterium]
MSERERIQVYEKNPRYWQYKGEPILLISGSDEDNLFNNPALLAQNFDVLPEIGGNYIRSTLSCRDKGDVWPFVETDGKYDLDKFNPEFFHRLENSCREAEARDIIVQIELWATYDFYGNTWLKNPWNPGNNINYSTENTHLETEADYSQQRIIQPFFLTPPALNNDTAALQYQDAFIRKVLDVTLPYPNVLYCLDNETKSPPEWALYWGDFIKRESQQRGVLINLTEMYDEWDISGADHPVVYEHPEYFSYTEVSQNNWQIGQTHYDRLMWFRENLVNQPGGIRPMNNVKVYGRITWNKPMDTQLNLDRWWQNIFAGCASTRFHRPEFYHYEPKDYYGLGLGELAQIHIRAARKFTSAFDIFSCEPRPDLLSETGESEAYLLANPGQAYAVYFPTGGRATITLESGDSTYLLRWFNVETAEFMDAQTLPVTASVNLESPSTGQIWLALIQKCVKI